MLESAAQRIPVAQLFFDANRRVGPIRNRLEQSFTRVEIEAMMEAAGLTDIIFSEAEPYWVACGRKA
jgi:hypothetical protein